MKLSDVIGNYMMLKSLFENYKDITYDKFNKSKLSKTNGKKVKSYMRTCYGGYNYKSFKKMLDYYQSIAVSAKMAFNIEDRIYEKMVTDTGKVVGLEGLQLYIKSGQNLEQILELTNENDGTTLIVEP